jgi:hypothetical protein
MATRSMRSRSRLAPSHDLRALVGADALPGLEAARRRLERLVEVGALGEGEAADRVAAGRVDDRHRPAGARGAPFAVDEELGVGIDAGVHAISRSGA